MRLVPATTWTVLALAPLPFAPPDPGGSTEELSVRYEEGARVVVEAEEHYTTETSSVSVSINGEELPEEAVEQMGIDQETEESVETTRTTTELTSVEDGRLVGARRTFDVLEKVETKGDEETELESPLVGLTLLLTEVEEDVVEAELEDDDADLDDVHLEKHRLDYPAEAYLPEDAVDVGDSWDLDEERIHRLLKLGGPTLYEPDPLDEAFEEAILENAEAEATVTYERNEERDGVLCAVLVVEVELTSDATGLDETFFGEQFAESGVDGSLSLSMEGTETLWLAIEGAHPVASELTLSGEMELEMVITDEEYGMEMVLTIAADMEGETTASWSVETD